MIRQVASSGHAHSWQVNIDRHAEAAAAAEGLPKPSRALLCPLPQLRRRPGSGRPRRKVARPGPAPEGLQRPPPRPGYSRGNEFFHGIRPVAERAGGPRGKVRRGRTGRRTPGPGRRRARAARTHLSTVQLRADRVPGRYWPLPTVTRHCRGRNGRSYFKPNSRRPKLQTNN